MDWNRLQNLSIVELGAVNGIVFGSLLELFLRAVYAYETYLLDAARSSGSFHIHKTPYPFSWWFLPVFSFVLVTAASYVVSRLLSQRIKSPFRLWQVIGFVYVFGACLYSVAIILYCWYFSEFDFLGVDYLADVIPREIVFVLPVTPLVICFNLLFASILSVWKKRLL